MTEEPCPYLEKSTCSLFNQKEKNGLIYTQNCNYWYNGGHDKCPIYKIIHPFKQYIFYFKSILSCTESKCKVCDMIKPCDIHDTIQELVKVIK